MAQHVVPRIVAGHIVDHGEIVQVKKQHHTIALALGGIRGRNARYAGPC